MKKLPEKSKIEIRKNNNEVVIVLPIKEYVFSYLMVGFMSFVSVSITYISIVELWRNPTFTLSKILWLSFFIFLCTIILRQLYLTLRRTSSEKIFLKENEIFIDTGVTSALNFYEKQDALTQYDYLRRKKITMYKENLDRLVLAKTKDDSLYLLTFEGMDKALYLGYRLTNEERKWLYSYILNFYNNTETYRVIALDESRANKWKMELKIYASIIFLVFFLKAIS